MSEGLDGTVVHVVSALPGLPWAGRVDQSPAMGGEIFRWGLEDLLDTYGVDMYFTGHIHMYERSYPTLRGKVQNYYNKPTFPVHINTGNSGNRSDFALGPERDFSAKRLVNVGCYSSVHIHNATHLTFQQKSNDDGTVLDEFVLEKERRGARS